MDRFLTILMGVVAIAALTASSSRVALAAGAGSADEKAVVACLQAVLGGFARRDRAAIVAQLLPGGMATLLRDGKLLQLTFDGFADRLSAPEPEIREERIHDPLVRIDDNIAVVWARFELVVNGKVARCGTDSVNFVKIDGRWLISSVGDTSRTSCGK